MPDSIYENWTDRTISNSFGKGVNSNFPKLIRNIGYDNASGYLYDTIWLSLVESKAEP